MSRRGENIRKRKDGRWEGRYCVLDRYSGKSVSHSVYARSYSEVKEKLAAAKMEMESLAGKECLDREVCFQIVAQEWFLVIEHSKKYSTYMKYRSVYKTHIEKKLGKISIFKLDKEILEELFRDKESEPLSCSLQKSISCVLNQLFSYAVLHYHVPIFSYSYPKQKWVKKPVEVLSQTEQSKLLQYLYQEMDIDKLGILLGISIGLRLGEICSLKWENIDLERKMLYVNTTVQRIAVEGRESKTILLEGEPKSIFSKREIPLSDEMIKLLLPYYDNLKKYVIRGDRPMEPRTLQNKFQRYLKLAGIEKKNFHILRHTFATNCINSGMDIKSLSEILGHSDVKITLNRYVHPTIETKRQYINSLSLIYGQYLGQTE